MRVITGTGDSAELIGGKLKQHRENNKLAIKTDLKLKLNELWNKHMGCYFDKTRDRTENVSNDFVRSKDFMKGEYEEYAVLKFGSKEKCVEIEEAYNDWYRDRNIEDLIKNFTQIGEENRNRLIEEQKHKEEIDRRKQKEKEKKAARKIKKKTDDAVKENEKKIEDRNESTKKEVVEKEKEKDIFDKVGDVVADVTRIVWEYVSREPEILQPPPYCFP